MSLCGLAFFCVLSFCLQVSYKHTQIISGIGQHILYQLGRRYILHMYISILHTVAGFAYFQFWCFQDTTALFNQFDPNSTTLSEFINVTDLQRLSALICAQTSVIREFIDEQLPWFQYQEWTWLGIGRVKSACM